MLAPSVDDCLKSGSQESLPLCVHMHLQNDSSTLPVKRTQLPTPWIALVTDLGQLKGGRSDIVGILNQGYRGLQGAALLEHCLYARRCRMTAT